MAPQAKTEEDYKKVGGKNSAWAEGQNLPHDVREHTWWKCLRNPEHPEWWTRYNDIQQGNGCPACAREARSKTRNDYEAIGRQQGFKWLGGKLPKNIHCPTWWRCLHDKCHEPFKRSYCQIRDGVRCPECRHESHRKKASDYKRIGRKRGIAWMEGQNRPSNVNTPTWWRCLRNPDHPPWKTRYGSIRDGSGCPSCARIERKINSPRGRPRKLRAATISSIKQTRHGLEFSIVGDPRHRFRVQGKSCRKMPPIKKGDNVELTYLAPKGDAEPGITTVLVKSLRVLD